NSFSWRIDAKSIECWTFKIGKNHILNLATYASVNEYGFLQTPYFKVENSVVDYDNVVYLTAADEFG
ncbi:hypothetical protein, partial [Mycoplasmopsis bovis]|uniref:hypothetical protein n=1 Tax=Mycoplasmopsis bovis TaxID=28903 RepID=UPI003D2DFDF0